MIRICLSVILLLAAWSFPSFASPAAGYSDDDSAALPDNFHGKVRYFGNHSSSVHSIRTFGAGPRKDCPRPDGSCPQRMGGSLRVELEFDGDIVHGTFKGTGGLRDSQLIGRREGSHCELFDPIDGSVWAGVCDRRNFAGTVTSVDNAQVVVTVDFKAVRIDVDNFDDAFDDWRQQAIRVRDYDRFYAQWTSADTSEDRVRAVIELTAFSAPVDPYVPGSMGEVIKVKDKGRTYLEVDYTLTSGRRAWVRARIREHGLIWRSTSIECYVFWDMPKCLPFLPPERPPQPSDQPPEPPSTPALPGGAR